MNLRHIIAEEFVRILHEDNTDEVLKGLDILIQKQPPGTIPELEKVVTSNILPYISSQLKSPLKEADEEPEEPLEAGGGAGGVAKEMGAHAAKTAASAPKVAGYVLSHLPLGKKMGVMIATALDRNTDDHVRNAVLFAVGNLIAGSMGLDLPDLGHLLQEIPETMWEILPFTGDNQEWDWGAVNALDDSALLTWAWLKVKNAVDVEEKLHEFGKFIGRSDLGKQPEMAAAGPGSFAPEDTSLEAKSARAAAAQEKGKEFRGLKETTIRKSEIYKMIKEEIEVILTNEEAEEMFDLNMSALLDEMMNEVDLRPEFIKDLGMRNVELCKQKAAGNEGAQCDEEKLKKYLAHQKEAEGLEEKKLSAKERRALPGSDFALPGKGEGPKGKQAGSYPIPDEGHAKAALGMVAKHGTSEEKAKVRAAVKRKFPDIEQGKG